MSTYRISRNIEASIIDYIKDELFNGGFRNINVEKTFARVYSIQLPTICVRLSDTTHTKVELGTETTFRTPLILIDIFATDDGLRLDLKDFLISKLKSGMNYYEYTISVGQVANKNQNGRIRVLTISDTPVNFDIDKSRLDEHDRYRHLLTLSISLGKVEQ
jgi:hypothetical protein